VTVHGCTQFDLDVVEQQFLPAPQLVFPGPLLQLKPEVPQLGPEVEVQSDVG
jgi:hypothetical protein